MFPLSCATAKIPLRSCNNACKQCAVSTKIAIQRTRLFFRAALLKIGGNIVHICKISANALKQESRTHAVLRLAQFTTAKRQGCANVSSNSSPSEAILRGWQTPRVDSVKLANYPRIKNAHKIRKKILVFYYVGVICTITKGNERIRAVV